MAEVAMDVPNKRYYIEKVRILVAEHFGVVTMCFTTKFTVPIFAVFDV